MHQFEVYETALLSVLGVFMNILDVASLFNPGKTTRSPRRYISAQIDQIHSRGTREIYSLQSESE